MMKREGEGPAAAGGPVGEHPTGRLVAYLDGELHAGAREMVEAHLAACAACRVELSTLAQARARLAALSAGEPARPVWPAVRARLDPARGAAFTPRFGLTLGAAAAAGFALVVALGLAARAPGHAASDPLASLGSSLASRSGIEIADSGAREIRP